MGRWDNRLGEVPSRYHQPPIIGTLRHPDLLILLLGNLLVIVLTCLLGLPPLAKATHSGFGDAEFFLDLSDCHPLLEQAFHLLIDFVHDWLPGPVSDPTNCLVSGFERFSVIAGEAACLLKVDDETRAFGGLITLWPGEREHGIGDIFAF